MTNPQAECPDDCEGCALYASLDAEASAKVPLCWCDPAHGTATMRCDNVLICVACAEGIARAFAANERDPRTRITTLSPAQSRERARAERDQRGPRKPPAPASAVHVSLTSDEQQPENQSPQEHA